MGRQAKSQWDFGELFPPAATRRVYTVSELTTAVKRLLERELGLLWVTGEISNYRLQSSGHAYFTLKDGGAQISCVLFRGTSTPYRELLEDGRRLVAQGELTVYEPRGQYQLVLRQLELQGVGALQAAFEQLKRKLQLEGLFDAGRKRPLPRILERVGVVTSPTGAALRDVLHVVERRNPALEIVLAPCRVQGAGAAEEVAEAIARLNAWSAAVDPAGVQAILVTRGGGSLEDLWAFNEEVVARAIVASTIPIVSAVGHEIDFTISDFAADLRAATPSAAAELLTEGMHASRALVTEIWRRLDRACRLRLLGERETLDLVRARIRRAHPRRRLEERSQRLDDLETRLARSIHAGARLRTSAWQAFHRRWRALRPIQVVVRKRETLNNLHRRFLDTAPDALDQARQRLVQAETRLRLLSPQNVLERGFSLTLDAASGAVIRDAARLVAGQRLRTRVQHGELHSRVEAGPNEV
jgi:exodeoxyribonuclease VII large subunit